MRELNVKQIEQINGGRLGLYLFAARWAFSTAGMVGPDKYSGDWHG